MICPYQGFPNGWALLSILLHPLPLLRESCIIMPCNSTKSPAVQKHTFLLSPQPFLFERCVYHCAFTILSPTGRQKTIQLTIQSSMNTQLGVTSLRVVLQAKAMNSALLPKLNRKAADWHLVEFPKAHDPLHFLEDWLRVKLVKNKPAYHPISWP